MKSIYKETSNQIPPGETRRDDAGTMAHKGHAANKRRSLQTKKMRCKQKTIVANKKDALQTKKDRWKQKKDALQTKNAVAGNRSRFSKY